MRALFASIAVLSVLASASSVAAGIVEPGGTPEATRLAITNPDEYAWQLFFFLNHQARPGVAGLADDSKPFGKVDANASVVWETWALASGGSASEVYKPNGGRPDDWDKLNRNGRVLILDRNLEREVVLQDAKSLKPFFFPPSPLDQEVRQNRGTFEFVVSKEMYNRDGLEGLRDAAVTAHDRQLISFPATAKEIKAQWLAIKDTDKPRYFWREIQKPDGTKTVFGLVSLHIITKDLPNWFWADFGHIDCETKKGACDTQDQEEAKTNPIDSTTRGPKAPSEQNGVRQETIGTVWSNYILRGTQINFVSSIGKATILSNPVIENGFQNSSCMSCHARASVGARRTDPNGSPSQGLNRLSPGDPTLGAPNPALFGAGPGQDEISYLQTDFIWSAPFRAQRKK